MIYEQSRQETDDASVIKVPTEVRNTGNQQEILTFLKEVPFNFLTVSHV